MAHTRVLGKKPVLVSPPYGDLELRPRGIFARRTCPRHNLLSDCWLENQRDDLLAFGRVLDDELERHGQ